MLGLNPVWFLFAIPGLILGIYAQIRLTSAYGKYSKVGVMSGLSGAEAARKILDQSGLTNVPVQEIPGRLSDKYDPIKRVLLLSTDNFRGRSVAAVGVAAHEAGHALQQQAAYGMFNFRMGILPAVNFASQAYQWIFAGSFLLMLTHHMNQALFSNLMWIAAILFAAVALFQIVTLPVEFDASRRAKEQLVRLGIVQGNETGAVAQVLGAAAMTYVAAMVSAILNLLYLVSAARRNS
jgi:Zn-dependent membrane protease YugP